MMVEGWGVAVDRLISDFAQGTVEWMVEEGERRGDWVIVEGQGSLDHPAYSAVTLALIHGATPQAMVLVHKAGQTEHDFDHLAGRVLPDRASSGRSSTSTSGWPGSSPRRRSSRSPSTPGRSRSTTRPGPRSRRIAAETGPAGRRPGPLRRRTALGRDRARRWRRCRGSTPGRRTAGPSGPPRPPRTPAEMALHAGQEVLRLGLRDPFRIARSDHDAGHHVTTVIVELRDDRFPGIVGIGEGYPDRFYGETPRRSPRSCRSSLGAIGEPEPTSAGLDAGQTPRWTAAIAHHGGAKCAIDIALRDLLGQVAGASVGDDARRDRARRRRPTSPSGSTSRRSSRSGRGAPRAFPALKIKVGRSRGPRDPRGGPGGLRRAAAGRRQHGLAARGGRRARPGAPAARRRADRAAVPGRSPRPARLAPGALAAPDRRRRERGHDPRSRAASSGVVAGVNVKLAKAGGPGPARDMLARARELGFRTFLGCMEETPGRDRGRGRRRAARGLGRPRRVPAPRRRSVHRPRARGRLPLASPRRPGPRDPSPAADASRPAERDSRAGSSRSP